MPRKMKSPYELVEHRSEEEGHPVDALVRRDRRVTALNERVQQAMRQFDKVLRPRQRRSWMALEELLAERSAFREERYFDRGYEHGCAAGRAEAMVSTPEARALAALLRDLALQAGLPRPVAVAALLEAAWSLLTTDTRVGKRAPR